MLKRRRAECDGLPALKLAVERWRELRIVVEWMEDSKFSYVREASDSVDVHHISLKRRRSSLSLHRLLLLLLISLFAKEGWISSGWLGLLLAAALLIKMLLRTTVHKESIMIMPDFGVQLETHYGRKVVRRFVPIEKLLQPVLNECVTPVTCYWSLSMIVLGEEELLVAFKELQPPVKMLVPVWKALCAIKSSANHTTSMYMKKSCTVEEDAS